MPGQRIMIYTTKFCRDCIKAKEFLFAKGVFFMEIDINEDPVSAEFVMNHNGGMKKVPFLDIEGKYVSGDKFDPVKFERELIKAGAL